MGTVFNFLAEANATAGVMSLAHATPAVVQHWQAQRLAQLLADARRGSAFYREHLRHLPEDACSLHRVAPVSRAELMAHFDDWVTDPRLELQSLQDFLADPDHIGQAYLGQYLAWESSGTSGEPGIFVQDAVALSAYDALETLRRPRDTGPRRWFDPFYLTERTAFLGATDGHFASYVSMERLRRLQPWLDPVMHTFSIMEPVDALVESLNDFAPTVLATYPTAALMLAHEAEHGRLHIHLHELWTGGETMSQCMRVRIERALQCRVRNSYGASEFLAMGWECALGHMHLNSDWVCLSRSTSTSARCPVESPRTACC